MTNDEIDACIEDLADHKILSFKRRTKDKDQDEVLGDIVDRCLSLGRNEEVKKANDALITLTHSGFDPYEIIERANSGQG